MSSNIVINQGIAKLMEKLLNKTEAKQQEISELFNNPILEKINKSKKFDIKHTKFDVDEYNLLIRENAFNDPKSTFGWVMIDGKPVNIHVTEELRLTESKEKIFDILMKDFIRRKNLNINKNAVAGMVYKALGIDVSTYIPAK